MNIKNLANLSQLAVVGNWKMNGSEDLAKQWFNCINPLVTSDKVWVGLCPSFVHLNAVFNQTKPQSSPIHLGSQDASAFSQGAYTAQTSLQMLASCGAEFSLIGHSEAREHLKQNDDDLAQKLKAIVRFCQEQESEVEVEKKMGVIFCVGEPLEIREQGEAERFIQKQLISSIEQVNGLENLDFFWIAYEPIWAIGTGRNASVEQAEKMHSHILQCLKPLLSSEVMEQVKVLYGGSVNENNANELLAQNSIGGVLVGGASLKPLAFAEIVKSALLLSA